MSVGPEYFTKGEYRTASVGAAIYEAYGTDGQNMRCAMLDYLPVEQQPEALSLNAEKTKKLGIRQKKSIMVQTDPLDAKEFETLTYESLDESIARVDENGVLTGVKKGTCTVVVRTAGGLEAQVEVQVVKDPVPDENPGGTEREGCHGGGGWRISVGHKSDGVHEACAIQCGGRSGLQRFLYGSEWGTCDRSSG